MAVRVFLQTFGCRANQYDSEAVAALVTRSGGTVVHDVADADVAVFNSCAVTAAAESDLRQQVRRAARHAPQVRTIVMGCAAARSGAALAELPRVHAVIGGADLHAVGQAIGLPQATTTGAPTGPQRGTRGLLRIQDGCNEHCTFCATTLARGASRSRPVDELVEEAGRLAAHHAEIVLTGVHIGSYGAEQGSSLAMLLDTLVRRVPAVRFRLSSVEATEVDAFLGELLVHDPRRVAPYLHAPLQSGSDAVLRRMGRHWYTSSRYVSAIEALLVRAPVLGLGADVVTGFPGETEADHRATCDVVQALPFSGLHVFPYSARPGTAAVRLGGDVPDAVRRARAAELRQLGASAAAAYVARRIGGVADVIVIGHADGHRDGLTEDYIAVELAQPAPGRGVRFAARLGAGTTPVRPIATPLS
ncbi:MAG: MiaB/RimO family radical SAM methylthiotransferase [Gemmatimonadaceae bacterium]|nr:MiaB/RimO family radical SAM methylthiotransferase [Gemmatimonadaceae bacterium]